METNEKEILLLTVSQLFMKYGVKSLTMDDISRHLGISKKTLYLVASNKKDLVNQCLQLMINFENQALCCIQSDEKNAIDEMLEVNIHINLKFQNLHSAVLYDLQKYYPETWKIMENHKNCSIHDMVFNNIQKGIKEGLYRPDIHAEIVAKIYLAMVDKLFEPNFFPIEKYSLDELHKEIAKYHIMGIASEKGLKYLSKITKEEN